jgi:AraC-like DNA-binding protein
LGQGATGELSQPIVPSIYAAQLVQLSQRWRVDASELLEATSLTPALLEDPQAHISPLALAELVLRALRLTDEPGLGFYYGLQLKLSSHGAVGMAALASATLREALHVAERFVTLRAPYLRLSASLVGERAELTLHTPGAEQLDERLIVFVTEALFTALVQIGNMLLGRALSGMVELAYREPQHFSGFAHLWPGPVRFARGHSRLVFPTKLLDEPLRMADEVAARRALLECERELATLQQTSSLLASVRHQLSRRALGFPSLTELARERHVSARTLKRKLAEQGTSYRRLLDELRRDRALALLEAENHTVEQVAEQLGYSDGANFNRAFRRWLSVSPSEWRAQQARPERGPLAAQDESSGK